MGRWKVSHSSGVLLGRSCPACLSEALVPVQEEGEALQEETDRPPTLSFPGGQGEESASLRQG